MSHEIGKQQSNYGESERPFPAFNPHHPRLHAPFSRVLRGTPIRGRFARSTKLAARRGRVAGQFTHHIDMAEPARSQADLWFIATGERCGSGRRKKR